MAIAIHHPGMDAKTFDRMVHKGMCEGCEVIETGKPGLLFVTSASTENVTYRVTRTECGCLGHSRHGYCKHRALAIAYEDVFWVAEHDEPVPPMAA